VIPPEQTLQETTLGFNAFELAEEMQRRPPVPPTRPEDFEPYHFLESEPRGQGSMGNVWLAEDVVKGRRVAIKLLRGVDAVQVDNEVRSQAKLEHSSIARLYDNGSLKDGTTWLAMEFIDGQPLIKYCLSANCTVERRLAIFHALCEAVRYAHWEGVDHGDLKPANILVKANGELKLVDFGLARRLHELSSSSGEVPVAGLTPAYAAPEQFRGSSPGYRTDVYSLGVILYELLCGSVPFDVSSHTIGEIARLKSVRRPLLAPSEVARQNDFKEVRLTRSLWRDLDALCLKAMDGDAKERYGSVEALLGDLDRYLRCEPLHARQPYPRGYRAFRFLRRNRVGVTTAAVIAVIVAVCAAEVAHSYQVALAENIRMRHIQHFMLNLFGDADLQAAPSPNLTVLAAADHWREELPWLHGDPETEIELHLTLGRVYEQLGQLAKADTILQAGLDLARAKRSETQQTLSALVQLGLLRGDQGRSGDARKLLEEALALGKRLGMKADSATMLNARGSLGRVLVQAGDYDAAIAILDPIGRLQATTDEERLNLREALTSLAVARQSKGQTNVALSLNRQVLELDRKWSGVSHPRVAIDLSNIATAEVAGEHFAEAEDTYRQALGILESRYGSDSVYVLQIKSFLAAVLMRTGNTNEAEQLLEKVLPVEVGAYGTDHPIVAFTHQLLGRLAENRYDFVRAEREYRLAYQINSDQFGLDDNRTLVVASALAGALLNEGRYATAEGVLRPVIKALTAGPLAKNVNAGIAELDLGESVLKQKRFQEAVAPLMAAYQILKASAGAKLPLDQVCASLAETYEALHEPERAASFRAKIGHPQPGR